MLALRPPTPRPALPELGADYGWPFLEGSAFGPTRATPVRPDTFAARGPGSTTTARSQLGGAAIIAAGAYWATGTGRVRLAHGVRRQPVRERLLLWHAATGWRLQGNGFAPAPDVPAQQAPGQVGDRLRRGSRTGRAVARRRVLLLPPVESASSPPAPAIIGRIISTTTPPPPPPPGAAHAAACSSRRAVNAAQLFLLTLAWARPAALTIHDPNGRRVRRFADAEFLLAARRLRSRPTGTARDDGGRKDAPGPATWRGLESGGRDISVRVPFLR